MLGFFFGAALAEFYYSHYFLLVTINFSHKKRVLGYFCSKLCVIVVVKHLAESEQIIHWFHSACLLFACCSKHLKTSSFGSHAFPHCNTYSMLLRWSGKFQIMTLVSSVYRMLFQSTTGNACFLAMYNLAFLFSKLAIGLHLLANPGYLVCSWSGKLSPTGKTFFCHLLQLFSVIFLTFWHSFL